MISQMKGCIALPQPQLQVQLHHVCERYVLFFYSLTLRSGVLNFIQACPVPSEVGNSPLPVTLNPLIRLHPNASCLFRLLCIEGYGLLATIELPIDAVP